MTYKMSLTGKDLVCYRTAQGLSRNELSTKIGISYPYLAKIETDQIVLYKNTEEQIRERLGLSDYRLEKLRSAFKQLRQI